MCSIPEADSVGYTGTLTYPDIMIARSAMLQCAQFLDRMATFDSFGRFKACSAAAIFLISVPASEYVHVFQLSSTGCLKKIRSGVCFSHLKNADRGVSCGCLIAQSNKNFIWLDF